MLQKMRFPNWTRGKLGVRARLIISLLVVVFPALLLLVGGDYYYLSSRQAADLEAGRATGRAALAMVQAQVGQAASLGSLILSAVGPDGQPAATEHLQRLLADHPEYLSLFILDAQGRLVAAAPAEPPPAVDPAMLAGLTYAHNPLVSDLYLSPPTQRPAVLILVPGWSPQGYEGAAGLVLDAQALGGAFLPLAQGSRLNFTLCDRKGWSIYSTLDPAMPWDKRDWSGYAHIRQAQAGLPATVHSAVSHVDGRAYMGVALPMAETGWLINVYQPAPDLLTYLDGHVAATLLAFVALTILGLVVALAVGKGFTDHLAHLAEHARGLGRGQLNERIDTGAGRDFDGLASALNSMAQQMEERDRRLRARTVELDAIITQSADGIAIHGPEGELQRLNPAGIRILGRTLRRPDMSLAEQVTWFKIRNASGAAVEPDELPVAAALRGETRLGQELRVETEQGQDRYVAFSASPLSGPRGRIYGAVSILRDTTQAHQAQQEKDDFISLVSHELKTPITSIKGYAQMLLRRAEEASSDARYLKGLRIINDEVDRMVDLINQLLDVSRLETHRLQLNWDRVDLTALVADAVDRLQMTTNRHTLRLRAPRSPVWVEGDGMRLAQVLGNLIMNAIKYSPAGGPVEITLENQQGRAWVSVRDWGIGIAPEDQAHVFQRFYRGMHRGSASLTGMGLGLYISREIVQRHNGDIAFHSQPGQGSTFLFWLPLAEPAAEREQIGEPGHGTAQ